MDSKLKLAEMVDTIIQEEVGITHTEVAVEEVHLMNKVITMISNVITNKMMNENITINEVAIEVVVIKIVLIIIVEGRTLEDKMLEDKIMEGRTVAKVIMIKLVDNSDKDLAHHMNLAKTRVLTISIISDAIDPIT